MHFKKVPQSYRVSRGLSLDQAFHLWVRGDTSDNFEKIRPLRFIKRTDIYLPEQTGDNEEDVKRAKFSRQFITIATTLFDRVMLPAIRDSDVYKKEPTLTEANAMYAAAVPSLYAKLPPKVGRKQLRSKQRKMSTVYRHFSAANGRSRKRKRSNSTSNTNNTEAPTSTRTVPNQNGS